MRNWIPDASERAQYLRWALIALALHLVAAVFTAGWFQYDEHWQIIEFANTILGRAQPRDLPWEYAAQARPSLQPWAYAGIEWLLLRAGETNPFHIAMVFRVLTSIVAWAAMMFAGIAVLRTMPPGPGRRWVAPALALAWFLPFLHARTSSENGSEAAFLVGFALLLLNPEGRALLIGLCFGLAFELRFQTGFMVAGAGLWCLFVARLRLPVLARMVAGLLLAFALGTIADRGFYGTWTFAPWNYLRVNLIEHRANTFGTSPWWAYFAWLPERLAPPLSLLFIVGTVGGWVTQRRSLMTWSMVPFLLVHTVIAHKELRFLFPLATLSVLMTVVFLTRYTLPRWSRVIGGILLTENLLVMAGASLLPAQPSMPVLKRIYELGSQKPMQIYYTGKQPYRPAEDMFLHFYEPKDLTMTPLDDYDDLERHVEHGEVWYLEKRFDLPKEKGWLALHCPVDTTTLPPWARKLDFGGWVGRTAAWTLFHCRP